MFGLILALFAALAQSSVDVLSKKNLKDTDPEIIAFSIFFFALPFLAISLIFSGIPEIKNEFMLPLVLSSSLNILAIVMFSHSLKISEISVSIPMLSFSPVFLLLTSPIIIGEFPSIIGIFGIILIVLGTYFLNFDKKNPSFLTPFLILAKSKGPALMLIVAIIWSISPNFDKIGIINSSPNFYAFALFSFVSCGMTIIIFFKSKNNFGLIKNNMKKLFPIGFFGALTAIFQTYAYDQEIVPYVVSIKRISILFSSISGLTLLKEEKIKQRIPGITLMIIGVFLIFGFSSI